MSGMLITFEGIEGVGKSTLQKGLAEALRSQGYDVLLTREPGGTNLGEKLRQAILLPDHEAVEPITELLIMFAARAQHVASCIKPALEQGKIILCDRFSDTSRAYQGGGRGLPMAWIEDLVQMTHPDLQPDITFWLDMPVEAALMRAQKRSAADRIEKEQVDFFVRAQKVYAALASQELHRFTRLDASASEADVLQQALMLFKAKVI